MCRAHQVTMQKKQRNGYARSAHLALALEFLT